MLRQMLVLALVLAMDLVMAMALDLVMVMDLDMDTVAFTVMVCMEASGKK